MGGWLFSWSTDTNREGFFLKDGRISNEGRVFGRGKEGAGERMMGERRRQVIDQGCNEKNRRERLKREQDNSLPHIRAGGSSCSAYEDCDEQLALCKSGT